MTGSSPARRGFFRRFLDLFIRRADGDISPPPLSLPGDVSEYRVSSTPLTVPADGGTLDFLVDHELTFRARGMSRSTLADRVESYLSSAERSLFNAIWPIGRQHQPQRPDQAEIAMNDAIREGWCYDENGAVVSCQARVYVRASAETVERQLPLWHRLVEMDMEHRIELHRLSVVDDLLTRWRDLIERFGDGPVVVHAAGLVDTAVAEVLRGLSDHRVSTAMELSAVLNQASHAHRNVGLYEFANAYDKALRSFERQAGLDRGTLVTDQMGVPQ